MTQQLRLVDERPRMSNKLTPKNQAVHSKKITASLAATEHLDVNEQDERAVLLPEHIQGGDAVRDKLGRLEIGETDITAAIAWSRKCN